jgi:hypothetical protein
MIPPSENPIILIDCIYGFFYKYFYISSAPLFPKEEISLFPSLLNVYKGRKFIDVKVFINDFIFAISL